MKIRKIAYILMIALLLLTACGKAETKENANITGVEKEKDKSQTQEILEEEAEEVSLDDIENTQEEEQAVPVQTPNDDNNKSNETKSNDATTENSSNTQTSTTKPPTNNPTTQKEEVKDDTPTDKQLKAEADAAASKYMNYYQEVLRLVNEIRAEVGVAPLTLNTTMCQAASMRAIEMDYKSELSHTRPDGSSCFTALEFYGVSYSSAGENIAMGYSSPVAVVNGWKNSAGHYKNMISPDFTQLGVGYSNMQLYRNTPYWVQLFAK